MRGVHLVAVSKECQSVVVVTESVEGWSTTSDIISEGLGLAEC